MNLLPLLFLVLLQMSQLAKMKPLPDESIKTAVPVIGVLTEAFRDYKKFVDERKFFIASSYVKWIESSGAQVLPILLNQDDDYYVRTFKQTNGLLFPGGDNLLDPRKNTPMMVAAKRLYELAVEANNNGNFYPIWGTCLGCELLSVLTADRNVLDHCSATGAALPVQSVARGKMFKQTRYENLNLESDYGKVMLDTLNNQNITFNFHHACLTDEGLKRGNLDTFYQPLAYSEDREGVRFIAIMEAYNYPFYGVQFHPEKPPFEFGTKGGYINVPHSPEANAASRYFSDFFVSQARLNSNKAEKPAELETSLIYNFQPVFLGLNGDIYHQRYLFPFQPNKNTTDEEFIDHVLAEDEIVPEFMPTDGESEIEFGSDINLNKETSIYKL